MIACSTLRAIGAVGRAQLVLEPIEDDGERIASGDDDVVFAHSTVCGARETEMTRRTGTTQDASKESPSIRKGTVGTKGGNIRLGRHVDASVSAHSRSRFD